MKQERDIVKLWKERDIEFAIYGIGKSNFTGEIYAASYIRL